MRVFRVEDAYGKGPYWGTQLDCNDLHIGYSSHQWPAPWREEGELRAACDKYGKPPDNFIFGFRSLRQMVCWFKKPARKLLTTEGYHLAVYDIPREDVKTGGAQVMFRRGEYKPVEVLPL